MTENWYATTTCKIHFDMHTPEDVENVGRDFDPQAFARAIKQTGAEAVCFFARCAYGWSYYPTTVGVPHPHLTRDLFGEGVAALKKEGIRVIAYCAIDNAPSDLVAHHPDWLKRSPEGEPLPVHGAPASVIAEDAEVIVRLAAPGQTYQIGARPPGQTLDAPALTFRRFGQGQVLFCALPLASDVWRRGNPGARYVIERMIRKVTPMLRVERVGSSAVQVYRSELGEQTLIHLVAYQPGGHTEMPHIIDSPCPVTGIQVYVRDQRQLKSVNLKPDGSSPNVQRVDGGILIDIPPFATHIAAVIQWH